jgi:hypothetical protein
VVDVEDGIGDTKHHVYRPGEFMIHDLESTGDTMLVFTTVEFKDSTNRPLDLGIDRRQHQMRGHTCELVGRSARAAGALSR